MHALPRTLAALLLASSAATQAATVYTAQDEIQLAARNGGLPARGVTIFLPPASAGNWSEPLADWFHFRQVIGQEEGSLITIGPRDISLEARQTHAGPGFSALAEAVLQDGTSLTASGEFALANHVKLDIDLLGVHVDEGISSPGAPIFSSPIVTVSAGLSSGSVQWEKTGHVDGYRVGPGTPLVVGPGDFTTESGAAAPSYVPVIDVNVYLTMFPFVKLGLSLNWAPRTTYWMDTAVSVGGRSFGVNGEVAFGSLETPSPAVLVNDTIHQQMELVFRGSVFCKVDAVVYKNRWDWYLPGEAGVSLGTQAAALSSSATAELPHKTATIVAAERFGGTDVALPDDELIRIGPASAWANLGSPIEVVTIGGCPLSPAATVTEGHTYVFSHWSDTLANGAERIIGNDSMTLIAYYTAAEQPLSEPEFRGVATKRARTGAQTVDATFVKLDRNTLVANVLTETSSRPSGWYWGGFLSDGEPDDWYTVWSPAHNKNVDYPRFAATLKQGWPYTMKFVSDGYPLPALYGSAPYGFTPDVPPAGEYSMDSADALVTWQATEAGAYSVGYTLMPLDIHDWSLSFIVDYQIVQWPPSMPTRTFLARGGETTERPYRFTGWSMFTEPWTGPSWVTTGETFFRTADGDFAGLPPESESTEVAVIFEPGDTDEGAYEFSLMAMNMDMDQDTEQSFQVYVFAPARVAGQDRHQVFLGETLEFNLDIAGTGMSASGLGTSSYDVSIISGPGALTADMGAGRAIYEWTPSAGDISTGDRQTHEVVVRASNSWSHGAMSDSCAVDFEAEISVRKKVDYALTIDSAFDSALTGERREVTFTASNISDADGSDLGYWVDVYADSATEASVRLDRWNYGEGLASTETRQATVGVVVPKEAELADVSGFTFALVPYDEASDSDPTNNSASFLATITVNLPPVANYLDDHLTAVVGEEIVFDQDASTDPEGQDLYHVFDFGDGNSAMVDRGVPDPWPVHAYSAPGFYTVTMEVRDTCGYADTDTFTVDVFGSPLRLTAPDGSQNLVQDRPNEVAWEYPGADAEAKLELRWWPETPEAVTSVTEEVSVRSGISALGDKFAISGYTLYGADEEYSFIKVFDETGTQLGWLEDVSSNLLAFTPDGEKLAYAFFESISARRVVLWDYAAGTMTQSSPHSATPYALAPGRTGGEYLIVDGDSPYHLKLYGEDHSLIRTYSPVTDTGAFFWPRHIHMLPDGTVLSGGFADGAWCWNPDGTERWAARPYLERVFDLTVSPDGTMALVALEDGTSHVIDIDSGEVLRSHDEILRRGAFVSEGAYIAAVPDTHGGSIKLYGPAGATGLQQIMTLDVPAASYAVCRYSTDGSRMLYTPDSADPTIWLWSLAPIDIAESIPNTGSFLWWPDSEHFGAGYLEIADAADPAAYDVSPPLNIIAPSPLSVTVWPHAASVGLGETLQLEGSVLDGTRDWTSAGVTWSVQSGGGSVDGSGVFTAPSSGGLSVVRCSSDIDGTHAEATMITRGSLALDAPNGGESWKIGSEETISWTGTGVSENVRLLTWKEDAPFAHSSPTTSLLVDARAPDGEGLIGSVVSGDLVLKRINDATPFLTIEMPGNVTAAAHNGDLLAVADQFGHAKSYRLPAGTAPVLEGTFPGAVYSMAVAPSPSVAGAPEVAALLVNVMDIAPALFVGDPLLGTDFGHEALSSGRQVAIMESPVDATRTRLLVLIATDSGCIGREYLRRSNGLLDFESSWTLASGMSVQTVAGSSALGLLAFGDDHGNVFVYEWSGGQPGPARAVLHHDARVTDITAYGGMLFSASLDGKARAWWLGDACGLTEGEISPVLVHDCGAQVWAFRGTGPASWTTDDFLDSFGDLAVITGGGSASSLTNGACSVWRGPRAVAGPVPGFGSRSWMIEDRYPSQNVRMLVVDNAFRSTADWSDGEFQLLPRAVPSTLVIDPSAATVHRGRQIAFSARVFDQYGSQVAAGPYSWSADGGGDIDAAGLFTATAEGSFTVEATWEDLTGAAEVEVIHAIPRAVLVVTPASSEGYPVEVFFDASGSTHPDDLPLAFEWQFDAGEGFTADRSTDDVPNTSWRYTAPGTCIAKVRVFDGEHADIASVEVVVGEVYTGKSGGCAPHPSSGGGRGMLAALCLLVFGKAFLRRGGRSTPES